MSKLDAGVLSTPTLVPIRRVEGWKQILIFGGEYFRWFVHEVLEEGYMADVLPKGHKVRKAVRWICDERINDANKEIGGLIGEASSRFNLSPREEEFLRDFYAETDAGEA